MINLNEEIDLVLEGSLGFEFLDEASSRGARRRRKEKARKKRAKKLAAKRGTEDRNRMTGKDNALATALVKIGKAAGADQEALVSNPGFIRLLAKVLNNPTYEFLSSIHLGVPGKEDLKGILWWSKMWLRIPRAIRMPAMHAPTIGPAVKVIETGAKGITKMEPQIRELTGGGDIEPPWGITTAWSSFRDPAEITLEFEPEEEEGGGETEETPAGGTPEEPPRTGTEEPEVTGTEEPEETAPEEPRALSDEERARLAQNIETATEWMAKRLVLMGPEYYNDIGTLRKQGRIIQKYFMQTREIREEDTSGSTPSSRTAPSARGDTGSDAADMLRLLSRKRLVTPEESNKHLEDLEKKVKPDALERKWRRHARADTDAPTHLKTTMALIQKYTAEGLSEAVVLKEDKIVEIVIDFNELREKRLDESFLAMFGGWVEHLLKAMFGGYKVPVNIRGSRAEVESFANTLGGEKRYIDAAKRYGLDHPTTYKNKAKLETAIKGFEKDTGLVWPYR